MMIINKFTKFSLVLFLMFPVILTAQNSDGVAVFIDWDKILNSTKQGKLVLETQKELGYILQDENRKHQENTQNITKELQNLNLTEQQRNDLVKKLKESRNEYAQKSNELREKNKQEVKESTLQLNEVYLKVIKDMKSEMKISELYTDKDKIPNDSQYNDMTDKVIKAMNDFINSDFNNAH